MTAGEKEILKDNRISAKTIISIIGAYAAYGIGSGFATGQEILVLGMILTLLIIIRKIRDRAAAK